MMLDLKSVVSVLASIGCLFSFEIFLVLSVISDFQLKSGYVGYHVVRLDLTKPFAPAGF